MLLVQFPDSIALASPISNNQIVNSWTNADCEIPRRHRNCWYILSNLVLLRFAAIDDDIVHLMPKWCKWKWSMNFIIPTFKTNEWRILDRKLFYLRQSTVCIDTIRWLVPGGGRYQCTQWLPTLHSILRSVYLFFFFFVFRMYGKHLYVIRSNALFHVEFTFGQSGARSTISFIRTNFPGTLTRWFTFNHIRSFRETNGKTVFHRSIGYRLLAIENHDILVWI